MQPNISLPLSLACYLALHSFPVTAQVIPDRTTSTKVNVDDKNFEINQGDRVGDNLFHSFEQFSVPTFGSAIFNNAGDIVNIFSRVTGGKISSIDGLINANGAANLFLINPNGIIFGENASLNIGGSFFASTAESLLFEDDLEFSATNPQAPPLLKVNMPIGLNLGDNPGEIVNGSFAQNSAGDLVGLEVLPGKNLTLLGGNIKFNGGTITAPRGRVELGAVAEAGIVGLNDDSSLSFPNDLERADIFLYGAEIDVVGGGGGSISIYADDLTIGTSQQIIGNAPQTGDTYTLQVSLEGEEANGSGVVAEKESNNTPETPQNIDGFFSLAPNSDISDDTTIPHVSISATGDNTLDYYSFRVTSSGSWGIFDIDYGDTGEAGSINTELFLFDNQGNLIADNDNFGKLGGAEGSISDLDPLISVFGFDVPGTYIIGVGKYDSRARSNLHAGIGHGLGSVNAQAGDVNIDATGDVTITGSNILNEVQSGAIGNAGNINLRAKSLLINNHAEVSSLTFGQGNAGNISIRVQDSVNLINPGWLTSRVEDGAVGNGGNVEIKGRSFYMADGAEIFAQVAFAEGNGGDISIEVADEIRLDNAYILGRAANGAIGDAGDINLKGRSLVMSEQALISASTFDRGNAGKINVEVSELVSLSNSVISSEVSWSDTLGKGGDINILTQSLLLSEGSELSVSSYGQGNAGDLKINTPGGTISISGKGSNISAEVNFSAIGDGGNITLNTETLDLINDSAISTTTSGQGNAGELTIQATDAVNLTDGGSLSSSASSIFSGSGNNLTIKTKNLNLRDGFINTTSFGQGDGGALTITATDSVNLDNASQIDAGSFGQSSGGDISIDTGDLKIQSNSFISTLAVGQGNAGKLVIEATNSVYLNNGSGLSTSSFGIGSGGELSINTENLTVKNGSRILTSTSDAQTFKQNFVNSTNLEPNAIDFLFSLLDDAAEADFDQGNAGNLTIQAREQVNILNNGSISTSGIGKVSGGSISLETPILFIDNGSSVSASTFGEGDGGNMQIATNFISLNNQSEISSETAAGNGGDMTLQVKDILQLWDSQISTTAGTTQAGGDGGNMDINVDLMILKDSDIIANAFEGQGGNINITTQGLFPSLDSEITASSELGVDGIVKINTPDVDPISGLDNLPSNVIDASTQMVNSCLTAEEEKYNKFILTGRGGIPSNPEETVRGDATLPAQWLTLPDTTEDSEKVKPEKPQSKESTPQIVEAKGWIINAEGNVVLTATANDNTPIIVPWLIPPNCDSLPK
ncbi:MAG: hypothetical protein Tsb0014_45450 [Pleurocapsa sp.]